MEKKRRLGDVIIVPKELDINMDIMRETINKKAPFRELF